MVGLFIDYLKYEKKVSLHTVQAYTIDLRQFQSYLKNYCKDILPEKADASTLGLWLMDLAHQGLSNTSINRKLASIKAFYKFLNYKKYLTKDPSLQLKSLKTKKRLPVFIREEELLRLLDQYPFPNTFEGWRERLVLELLYGTGIRLSELLTLKDLDINLYEHTIKVLGKRNKERIIPYPKSISGIIQNYQIHRNKFINNQSDYLLVANSGLQAYPMLIYKLVKKHLSTYTEADRYSPHVLRHTFATHLLNKGADLNAIKELLGHESLAATQVYTHNSLEKLKEIFKQAHPRAC
jgi:integrase/recombinase XerC